MSHLRYLLPVQKILVKVQLLKELNRLCEELVKPVAADFWSLV